MIEFFRDLKELSEKYLERLCGAEASSSMIMSSSFDSGIDLIDLSHATPVASVKNLHVMTSLTWSIYNQKVRFWRILQFPQSKTQRSVA